MLTVMCPNCRHRFPAPGCCNPTGSVVMQNSVDQFPTSCGSSYCNGSNEFLVPRGYLNGGGGCVINAPTIIHGPTIIQSQQNDAGFINTRWLEESGKNFRPQLQQSSVDRKGLEIPAHCQIGTNGGGSVTVANKKTDQIEDSENLQRGIFQNPHPMLFPAPSGCQDLPGLAERNTNTNTNTNTNINTNNCTETAFDFQISENADWTRTKNVTWPNQAITAANSTHDNNNLSQNLIHMSSNNVNINNSKGNNGNGNGNANATLIQVNATLHLPPNVAQCTVSITATANTVPSGNARMRNNFNGGGIVETDSFGNSGGNASDREDNSPTTPVSWVLPFPWGVKGNTGNNSTDLERLSAAQRVLQTSGWYHEGLSWQQSAALLKNAAVGSWLMRDSSDKRYMYAVSVQTARGPTAVRVHYLCGKFRLDAEPRMAPLMPMFECPVKMIEHYIEYSKKMSKQKEVWVDHSGQLYSQIYLTKPLLKEVRSLSHIARLAVNRNNISTKELPPRLKEFIADYPYTE